MDLFFSADDFPTVISLILKKVFFSPYFFLKSFVEILYLFNIIFAPNIVQTYNRAP